MLISGSATDTDLTHADASSPPARTARYYPRGIRNFARTNAPVDRQAAALASAAKRLGVTRLYVLSTFEASSFLAPAQDMRAAAAALGIRTVGFETGIR